MMKKVLKILGVTLIILTVLVVLIVVFAKWSNSTVGEMTEPIRKEFSSRTNDTFRIRDSVYGDSEGTSIVSITNKDGKTHEEKYFLKKTGETWVVENKEPYVAPSSTVEIVNNNVENKTNFAEVTVVDSDDKLLAKDGDLYVINTRNRYFARVTLVTPLTETTSFKHTYKKTSSGFVRGFTTEVLFPKDPPLGVLYVELKPKDGFFSVGTYESTISVGGESTTLKYRVE